MALTRTLRIQAADYAKVPRRILLTYEYTPSPQEQMLYDLLYAYVNQPIKLAFPEMDPYDLALRLLGLQGSSTAAILQTIRGVIRRLEQMPNSAGELAQWREMERAALEAERAAFEKQKAAEEAKAQKAAEKEAERAAAAAAKAAEKEAERQAKAEQKKAEQAAKTVNSVIGQIGREASRQLIRGIFGALKR